MSFMETVTFPFLQRNAFFSSLQDRKKAFRPSSVKIKGEEREREKVENWSRQGPKEKGVTPEPYFFFFD